MDVEMANVTRSKTDPKVLDKGPSSLSWSDRVARNLGWFSLGLGALEIFAPGSITRALGVRSMAPLVCAYGAREIASGSLLLSADKKAGLWSRVAGDGVNIATLIPGLHRFNPKRGNAKLAMAAVLGLTLLDLYAAAALSNRQRRTLPRRSYRERSGFPNGVATARGAARNGKMARLAHS
jgi:hypothetical protein